MDSNYFSIGSIVATHGWKGEMVLKHALGESGSAPPLKDVDVVFIEERKGSFLPFFVSGVRAKAPGEVYLLLEGVESRERARGMLRKGVYLDEPRFRTQVREDSYLYYLGYIVEDAAAGRLGPVAEIMEMPSQLLAKVYREGKELLIPLTESTLQRIDTEGKVIYVELPDGLLEVY